MRHIFYSFFICLFVVPVIYIYCLLPFCLDVSDFASDTRNDTDERCDNGKICRNLDHKADQNHRPISHTFHACHLRFFVILHTENKALCFCCFFFLVGFGLEPLSGTTTNQVIFYVICKWQNDRFSILYRNSRHAAPSHILCQKETCTFRFGSLDVTILFGLRHARL